MALVVAGLWGSVFSGFLPALLVLIGIGAILVGVFAVLQTRRWPRAQVEQAVGEEPQAAAPAPPATPTAVATVRPSTTTDTLHIAFPEIEGRHPDVWGMILPLQIVVRAEADPGAAHLVRLSVHAQGRTREIGEAPLGDTGTTPFTAGFDALGEHDLIAELLEDKTPRGQAVRRIRIADYRNEIVETFEDFVSWAASHFDFVDRRMTAREFVDRYADGRAGTPVAPLGRIADLYELANYSEHPVDRRTYLELVDAFLELEDAGALEGPGEA